MKRIAFLFLFLFSTTSLGRDIVFTWTDTNTVKVQYELKTKTNDDPWLNNVTQEKTLTLNIPLKADDRFYVQIRAVELLCAPESCRVSEWATIDGVQLNNHIIYQKTPVVGVSLLWDTGRNS